MSWSTTKKHVLVPYDFSDASKRAISAGRAFVEDDGALTVLYVVMPPAPTYPGLLWGDVDTDDLRTRAAEALAKDMDEVGHGGVRQVVVVGQPAREIVDFAASDGVELVVIPSHGRTGLDRWLLGSVAERVVRNARCPVLVLRHGSDE
jgi:nucleotide-binding universal stress UspA family protein